MYHIIYIAVTLLKLASFSCTFKACNFSALWSKVHWWLSGNRCLGQKHFLHLQGIALSTSVNLILQSLHLHRILLYPLEKKKTTYHFLTTTTATTQSKGG